MLLLDKKSLWCIISLRVQVWTHSTSLALSLFYWRVCTILELCSAICFSLFMFYQLTIYILKYLIKSHPFNHVDPCLPVWKGKPFCYGFWVVGYAYIVVWTLLFKSLYQKISSELNIKLSLNQDNEGNVLLICIYVFLKLIYC